MTDKIHNTINELINITKIISINTAAVMLHGYELSQLHQVAEIILKDMALLASVVYTAFKIAEVIKKWTSTSTPKKDENNEDS